MVVAENAAPEIAQGRLAGREAVQASLAQAKTRQTRETPGIQRRDTIRCVGVVARQLQRLGGTRRAAGVQKRADLWGNQLQRAVNLRKEEEG